MSTKPTVNYKQRASSMRPLAEEVRAVPGYGQAISVRAAKAHLSALLELVASGTDVTITSGGQPKARLVGIDKTDSVRTFKGATAHLAKMPQWKGDLTGEQHIRTDRDSRI